MEALFNVTAALGLIGSVVLIAWGMVLCVRYGFGAGAVGPERTA